MRFDLVEMIYLLQFLTLTPIQVVPASGQAFAFSRHRMLPFSSILSQVNKYTPVNAVWFVVIIAALNTWRLTVGLWRRTMSRKAEITRRDEELLAGLGYKQEFKRTFTPLEVRRLP